MNRTITTTSAALLFLALIAPLRAQSTQPTAQPAAAISPDAKALLEQVRQAYKNLQHLEVEGMVTSRVDVGGQQQSLDHKISGAFRAPTQFRHEFADLLVIGTSPEKTYAFNKTDNSYLLSDTPDAKSPLSGLPQALSSILEAQNPSLAMALDAEPLADLSALGQNIRLLEDEKVDGQAYRVVAFEDAQGGEVRLLIDPKTHLIRRLAIDAKSVLMAAGEKDVKEAKFAIDYTQSKTQGKFADGHFAWSPPEGSRDMSAVAAGGAPSSMVGQPAPAFALDTLDGENVSLADLKGQVVLLDFWATWCPPCVESLPHLGQMYRQAQDNVKIFGVNLMQDQETVESFMRQHNIDIPVLMDKDGAVAAQYGVSSIPQTVLIDKEGIVRKVFVGLGPDTYSEIREAIRALQ